MIEIGDRIKEFYENRYRFYLTRRTPVILRLDGSAFHSFTKNFDKPFDQLFMNQMVNTVESIQNKIQGFQCAYVQSDEVSILLTDYKTFETSAWFDYNKSKLESVTASLMSAHFQNPMFSAKTNITPYFDCRSFNIPREDVVNYFVWRAKDWERNSLQMYCSTFFSHKELHKKKKVDKHEMLHKIGKNWTTDLTERERNGTLVFADYESISFMKPTYEDFSRHLNELIYIE